MAAAVALGRECRTVGKELANEPPHEAIDDDIGMRVDVLERRPRRPPVVVVREGSSSPYLCFNGSSKKEAAAKP